MSRRRRKGNPLLMRIIVVSVLLHIIFLPVLAHFGAFKKIQAALGRPEVIVLPPPEKERIQPEVKKTQKVAQTQKAKSAGPKRQGGPKSNLNQPKVVATNSPTGTADNGPTVDANGSGTAGQVPTVKNPEGTGTKLETGTSTTPEPKPTETPKKQPEPEPAKTAPPVTPKPEVKAPVFTEVEATFQPSPVIPDDLRADALNATLIAEFVVLPDGSAGQVKVTKSSGNDELDRIALDTARKWKFKPATRDGEPIESRVRLHIEFEVK